MKKLVILLLVVCTSVEAQHSLLVKDGNGQVLGISTSLGVRDYSRVNFLTSEGNLVEYELGYGVRFWSQYSMFETTDCTGPEYTDYPHASVTPKFIVLSNDESPRRLALLPAIPKLREVTIRSSYPNGPCSQWSEPQARMVVPLADYAIDPSKYGFVILPEANEWGFSEPITVEQAKSDIIMCTGFEACPQQ